MAELTRKQAKESGMLGDYAHMFDIDALKTQIPVPQETQPPNAVFFASFNHVTTRTVPTYIIEAFLFDDSPYDGSYKLAEFQGFIINSNTLQNSLNFGATINLTAILGPLLKDEFNSSTATLYVTDVVSGTVVDKSCTVSYSESNPPNECGTLTLKDYGRLSLEANKLYYIHGRAIFNL